MSKCVFCEPENLKSWYRYLSDDVIVFEPLNPVVNGHVCVMPVEHVADFTEKPYLTGEVMRKAAAFAKGHYDECNLITSKGRAATQSINHLHVHIVPRFDGDGLRLPWTKEATDDKR